MNTEDMTPSDEGNLESISVPKLLAEAWRVRRTGVLVLSRGRGELRVQIEAGAPLGVETSLDEDRFAQYLADTHQITTAERAKVETLAGERECPQASAVLALRLLDAKALYTAMRDASRAELCSLFAWQQGTFGWSEFPEGEKRAGKPFDILDLLQQQLPKHWGTDRLFSELMPDAEAFGELAPRFRRVVEKLGRVGSPAGRLISRLDGSVSLGQLLGEAAGDPLAASTLWVLIHAGLIRLHAGKSTTADEPSFDFEVVVESDPAATEASSRPGGAAPKAERGDGESPKAQALRQEIEAFAGQLGEIDHYAALGLSAEASPAEIKKAYFKAAKKYHPDALARMGLEAIRDDAAQVFARIAEAFEILSDPDKKATYDAGGDDFDEIDTARLAQAETSYRKGEILLRMGNFGAALEYFEPAVELWPDEPAYQTALGWSLFRQNQPDVERAREHLQIARDQAPEDPVTMLRLGLVLRAQGETGAANEVIARAREIDPDVEP